MPGYQPGVLRLCRESSAWVRRFARNGGCEPGANLSYEPPVRTCWRPPVLGAYRSCALGCVPTPNSSLPRRFQVPVCVEKLREGCVETCREMASRIDHSALWTCATNCAKHAGRNWAPAFRGVFRKRRFGASVTRGERSPLVVTAYGHHQGIHAGSSQTVDADVDSGLNRLRDLPNVTSCYALLNPGKPCAARQPLTVSKIPSGESSSPFSG
jgi:hypothetical protein